jgi:hypothetical protein
MKKLLSILSLASIATTIIVSPASAEPYTIRGQKGNYTINHSTGTYRGCLFKGGCITLGRKYLIPCVESNGSDACDVRRWKKGEYTYEVYIDENVTVSKNGQGIFYDAAKR